MATLFVKQCVASVLFLAIGGLAGCSATATKSADVSDSIRKSLDVANLKDVSVTQDRDKGVVTLGGHVTADGDKSQAESIAKSMAGSQVMANQIAVVPSNFAKEAKWAHNPVAPKTETAASGVPNVQQVVNELQVKNQKASSSN